MITKNTVTGSKSVLGIDKSHFAFYMAKDFFDKGIAATNDLHRGRPKSSLTEKTHWMVCFPACSLAFSLELSLKGFLTDEQIEILRKKREGHNLLTLYNSIDIDTQNKIESHFEECEPFKNTYYNMSYRPSVAPVNYPTDKSTKGRIIHALEKSNNAFEDFRYFYSLDPTKEYWFDFNTIVQLTHACLAVRADELGITVYKKV